MFNKNQLNSLIKLVIFGIGGLLGALMNWSLTYTLTEYLAVYYVYSNIIGSSVNSVFNFLYHRSITFKVNSSTGNRFLKFLAVNVFIVALNVLVMFALTELFHIWYILSAFLATCFIVAMNFLLNQSLVFFEMGSVDFRGIRGDFFYSQMDSKNPLRALFHKTSESTLGSLIRKYFAGGVVVELGRGNCSGIWNDGGVPLTGVDVNDKMLSYAKARGRLRDGVACDIGSIGIKDERADMAIISDALVQVGDYQGVLEEAGRIMKPGGTLIVRVPYGNWLGLWKPLFYAQCIMQGYLFGNDYYRNRCGHIRSFSSRALGDALYAAGFKVVEESDLERLVIFMAAKKEDSKINYSDVTVIVPTLNERENIARLLDTIEGLYPGAFMIVADDGSKDGTRDIVLQKHGLNEKIGLLDRSDKPHGLTASVMDAILATKTPYFVVIDADFQHPPDKIRVIVQLLQENDMAVGTREKVENWGLYRRLMSFTAGMLGQASLVIRRSARCNDILSGFFGGRTAIARRYIEKAPSTFSPGGYKILFDLLKLMPASTKIGEVPYTFVDRSEGHSKINNKHVVIYFKSLFK
jgi:dolichol-phosphate mannosyltransferase